MHFEKFLIQTDFYEPRGQNQVEYIEWYICMKSLFYTSVC